jgi:hypothetical protein
MTTTLSANVSSTIKCIHQASQAFSVTYTGAPQKGFERAFSSSDITKLSFANYSVTTTPTTIDLTSLTDPFGNAVNFATVKNLLIINNDATNSLTIGGGTNGLFAALPFNLSGDSKGTCLNLTTSITVDSTHKILKLLATAGTISVDVFVIGS